MLSSLHPNRMQRTQIQQLTKYIQPKQQKEQTVQTKIGRRPGYTAQKGDVLGERRWTEYEFASPVEKEVPDKEPGKTMESSQKETMKPSSTQSP